MQQAWVWLLSLSLLLIAGTVQAQAPSAIQFFMPGGGLPAREIRFTLTRDDGRVEILFTDTKGKFQLSGDLLRDRDYTIRVESDGRTYDTTVVSFRVLRNIIYVPVFLRPLKGEGSPPKEVVDLAVFDAGVPDEARAAYERGMKAVAEGKVDTALNELKRALDLYPTYLRALNDLGVLHLKLNSLEEAAETFRQAIKLNQRFYYPRLNLGIVLNRQGNYGEAAQVLGQLHKEVPTLTGLRFNYAEALAGIGKLTEAKERLREALNEANLDRSTKSEIHFKLGVLLNREERFAEAARELEQAVALDPNAANAHLQLGGALLQVKRLAEAERELLRAYQLGGSAVGAAQLLLGQIYFIQQRYELALHAFEQYLKDVTAAPNAAQIKGVIERIKAALNQK